MMGVEGVADLSLEQQTEIPFVRFILNRTTIARYGLRVQDVADAIETSFAGTVVGRVFDRATAFDLVVKLDPSASVDFERIADLPIHTPTGETVPIRVLADVRREMGPNMILRENVQRRIVVSCNTSGRDLGSVVADIQAAVARQVPMPDGYHVEYGGQFESQQRATTLISVLAGVALAGMFLVLYLLYPSARIVLQILNALPTAFIGGVLALWLTGQTLTVASMVGFISLGGIAARNGILLVSHYFHLMRHEGEGFTPQMVLRGSLERLAPVLMTALTAGIALVPLVVAGHQPGREILYPVATVILGGLVTSTLCEFLIHPGLFWKFSGRDAEQIARAAAE
jgi:Cu/Ag efflux pump CusA